MLPAMSRPRGPRSPRRARLVVGLAAVALGLACASAASAAVSRVLQTPDETAHVDYAYQVWHGRLPVFEDGVSFQPGRGVRVPPVQWEAQHPPLYYLLVAPAVGPLVDAGRWKAAVLAARGVNVLLTVGCALALAWAAAQVARRRRWAWALAVPAVVAPITPFVQTGGTAYSDPLSTMLVALSLGLAVLVLRQGPTRARLAWVAALSALGALARGSFVVTLVVVSAAVGAAVLLHDRGHRGRWAALLCRAAAAAAIPFAAALLAAGWFYRRNIRLTGSWAGGHPDWSEANLGRHQRTLDAVLHDFDFWRAQTSLLWQRGRGSVDGRMTGDWGRWVLLATLGIGLVAGLVWLIRGARAPRVPAAEPAAPAEPEPGAGGATLAPGPTLAARHPLLVDLAILLALTAQVLGLLATIVLHAMNTGGPIVRYLLPGLLPIGLVLAAGVLAFGRRLAGLALLVYLVLAWGVFGQWMWITTTQRGVQTAGSTLNGVPWRIVWIALGLFAVAVLVQAAALTDWSRRPPADEAAEPGGTEAGGAGPPPPPSGEDPPTARIAGTGRGSPAPA